VEVIPYATKKVWIYELRCVAHNTRTGVKETRELPCNGHGRLNQRGLESLLTWGAHLYAKGWDSVEFSIDSATVVSRESFARVNIRK
jgi:hypothetical protein